MADRYPDDGPHEGGLDGATTSSVDCALEALLGAETVLARQRRHWVRQGEREATTLVGLLVNLAESGAEIGLDVAGGRRFGGRVRGVGPDVVTLVGSDGRAVVVRLDRVSLVRPHRDDRGQHAGHRVASLSSRFTEVLVELAAERPTVAVHLAEGDPVLGRLQWCGRDVCCVTGGSPALPLYVPIAAIAAVAVIP